jgi:hypothetical protein
MLRTLTLLLLSSAIVNAAPKMEIKIAHQKVTPLGHPYGSPGGIYFKITDIDPLLPYWVQYSQDLKNWKDLYNFGSFGDKSTSPLFHWYELPPEKCFFRIVQKF